jgi:hypothetical protein
LIDTNMRQKAAVVLYRTLLRESKQQYERFGTQVMSLRAPLDSAPGSWNSKATAGSQYQLDALESLVPGLAGAGSAFLASEQQRQQQQVQLVVVKQLDLRIRRLHAHFPCQLK